MSKDKTKKGKSPYTKYNKRPFQYSDLFMRWQNARVGPSVGPKTRGTSNPKEAQILGEQHSLRWLGVQYTDNKRQNAYRAARENDETLS